MTDLQKRYGWKPSLPDGRDVPAFAEGEQMFDGPIPVEFSLRGELPPVLNQGPLGSCTANAIAGLLQYYNMLKGTDFGVPSRLFIYYLERLREGTITQDSGAYGRDGFASLRKTGAPPEELWPYVIEQFTQKPSEEAFAAAAEHKIHHYTHARSKLEWVQALILRKQPVAFGFTVYQCFEGEQCMRTGVMPFPSADESVLGGHEVYAFGWKEIAGELYLECRNSWGPDVMDEGNFWLPVKFVFGGNASDFRAIQS